ncbi:5-(carboxyamino)imidazole ribonucleotide mutase [uncultured Methanospirillum sp.]|uniref:5-(carboxyamino)imidazole ribonucleotide mutase n=1 Tax=uncultured Methanospirillum sp. TaxID=262503 RepID=UPI0029C70660|nr:5-(carboxyamino)imidazole ribonucleotide mutase [uncultured Methanospirillum sp.]
MVDVSIICGSASDEEVAEKVWTVLKEKGISYDYQVISAHRNPDRLDEYVTGSDANVFICIAGLSAALPGVVASKTEKPVIGVPVSGKLMGGLDALLSIVQMPKGVPVACVGVDNGQNAAHLAVRILNLCR